MEEWKDLFAFNRNERRGIWLLLLLLMMTASVCTFLRHRKLPTSKVVIHRLLAEASQKTAAVASDAPEFSYDHSKSNVKNALFAFDPNTITQEQWVQLGLSPKQASVIIRYTEKGGRFYSPDDLKRCFVINESFFSRVKPWIRIATPSQKQEKKITLPYRPRVIDLNLADTVALASLPGIGNVLARRIVNYRKSLGGYHSVMQLKEVFGMPEELIPGIETKLSVSPADVTKINLSVSSLEELQSHPYISKKMAYAIVELRKTKRIDSADDLKKRMPTGIVVPDNLIPYLQF
jgi:competence protein ComEA